LEPEGQNLKRLVKEGLLGSPQQFLVAEREILKEMIVKILFF
jgi:hypothetical protein